MLGFFPVWLAAPFALFLYLVNTVVCLGPLMLLALGKLLLPLPGWRNGCDQMLIALGRGWIAGCNLLTGALYRIDWSIDGPYQLDRDSWYLVLANHQSWVDLLVFMRVFGHALPFPKVFAKRQILWIPFIGAAVWALDFPLVKRYPAALLERRPELRGVDRAIALRACRRALQRPTTMVNFLEGTRFTPAKQVRQGSPYRYLLRPRTAGAALVVQSLGNQLTAVLDLSIAYPDGPPTFWRFLGGGVRRVAVRLQTVPVPEEFRSGDYEGNPADRERFQSWVAQLWREKDRWLDNVLKTATQKAAGRVC